MKKILFFLFLFLCPYLSGFASEIDYPLLSGHVVDEAGVLSKEEKEAITQILLKDKNDQVAVVILKDLRGRDGREYGIELARHWQLGQKDKDNGVLILFSVKDRYAGIEVGYGLEGVLTDSIAGRILREEIFPPLKANLDYGKAAYNGAKAVTEILLGKEVLDEQDGDFSAEDIFNLLATLFFIYLFISRRGRSGGGRPGGGISLRHGEFSSRFTGGGGRFGGGGAGGRF